MEQISCYNDLIKVYDRYDAAGLVTPIAHTKINFPFGVLVNKNGMFIGATQINERLAVPCTVESESRTSNIAPHLIHDNLSYISNMRGMEKRHRAYMEQLFDYISNVKDEVAFAVYKYISRGTILDDIAPLLKEIKYPIKAVNVCFTIPGVSSTINRSWTEYYLKTLPKNGICPITGEKDHIPESYPREIRKPGDFARLFTTAGINSSLLKIPQNPGYIAAQKIVHALQWLAYDEANWANAALKELERKGENEEVMEQLSAVGLL